ncbi:hypothetical protein BJ742DRAFT_774716 [Cladochytrium replicatum]|nr:hypothetical protein BJ742DRAFT_774716 [Cladochytrium replicatum]
MSIWALLIHRTQRASYLPASRSKEPNLSTAASPRGYILIHDHFELRVLYDRKLVVGELSSYPTEVIRGRDELFPNADSTSLTTTSRETNSFVVQTQRRIDCDRLLTEDYNAKVYSEDGIRWVEETTFARILRRHFPGLRDVVADDANAFFMWKPKH